MCKEWWRPVVGYEGFYEISNYGRVKSIARKLNNQYSNCERILHPRKNKLDYLRINLCDGIKVKTHLIHKLVSKAYLPNPNNYPCVNHKDENPSNNFVWVNDDGSIDFEKSNLEWCTQKYNSNYGTRNDRISKNGLNKHSKTTLQLDLEGNVIKEWLSVRQIQRETGYKRYSIERCCNGKQKTAYGFKWSYAA